MKSCHILAAGSVLYQPTYFVFAARNFAQRARAAAAIRFRPAADIVCFGFGARPFTLAHRAFCASAIFRREAADIIRFGRLVSPVVPVPSKDSIAEIAWFNFSKRDCVALRSLRSS